MTTVVVLVILAAVISAAAAYALPRLATRRLRRRFGPEYDRALLMHGGRRRGAERELTDRLRSARTLEPVPLSPQRTETVVQRLGELQEMFIDEPLAATREADKLLAAVLGEIGFPAKGRLAALSVDHGDRLPAYRAARSTVERAQTTEVGTEELRTALLAIRDLCLEVLRAEFPAPRVGQGEDTGPTHRQPITPRTN